MKLNFIRANRHILAGEVNGRPLRLLLNFGKNELRLQVAGDGERMIVDQGHLDEPLDLGECGQIDITDVTQLLFPTLRGVEVADVQALEQHGRRVGVKLNLAGRHPYHFWVDGDELYWGDEATLAGHDWLDEVAPTPGERIAV